ncbi:MAG: CesT family type III secretion system chaperone, partial [Chlamydiia bacterium]|nr:CesT family type III secretion system chaperone [Chlamydiia bacterium]
IPPGRYRADFFRQALKANGLPPPRFGTFAYSKQANSFVAYEILPRATVTAEAIAEFLLPFMEKARKWKEGLERGEIPSLESSQSPSPSGSGMFGLR